MGRATRVQYSAHARNDLLEFDRAVSRRIVLKIAENTSMLDPLARATALHGEFSGLYRYRIGDYRAIFEYSSSQEVNILTILRIKHRKDIYR